MAESKAQSGWGAEMNAEEHIGTYDAFIKGSKWGIGALVVLLILMAIFLL
ncbi:aa3-type cytochrome c oxidase subunit IV [Parvibaculum sp.]